MLLTGAATVAGLAVGPLLQRLAGRLEAKPRPRSAAATAQLVLAGVGSAPVPADASVDDAPAPRSPGLELAVSALTGTLFGAMAWRFGADPVLPAYLYLVAVGVTLSLVDLRSHRLPNALTLPAYPITFALLATAALLGSSSGSPLRALLGGAASYLLYLALRVASPRGVGFGDVKLAGVLGMYTGWLGWDTWTLALLTTSLVAGAVGAALLTLRRLDRRSHLAYGPFLVTGAITASLVGQQLLGRSPIS